MGCLSFYFKLIHSIYFEISNLSDIASIKNQTLIYFHKMKFLNSSFFAFCYSLFFVGYCVI